MNWKKLVALQIAFDLKRYPKSFRTYRKEAETLGVIQDMITKYLELWRRSRDLLFVQLTAPSNVYPAVEGCENIFFDKSELPGELIPFFEKYSFVISPQGINWDDEWQRLIVSTGGSAIVFKNQKVNNELEKINRCSCPCFRDGVRWSNRRDCCQSD